jgi:hypothetical protein
MLAAGIFMGTLSTFQYLTDTFTNNYGGFAQVLYAGIVGQAESYRIAGSVGDPNFFGQVLVMLVPLGFDRMLNERSLVLRLLGLWGVMVCLLAMLFT